MTPLMHKIVKELTLPASKRSFVDMGNIIPELDDVHPFDCSDVLELAMDLGAECKTWAQFLETLQTEYLFLPAPKTWLEFRTTDGKRCGALFVQGENNQIKNFYVCMDGSDGIAGNFWSFPCDTMRSYLDFCDKESLKCGVGRLMIFLAMLVMINQPRIIGRKTHQPHKGLAKAIKNAKGHSIAHPFRAWTEITLDVSPTQDVSDEEGFETRLTGKKALHFCRAHLRLWMGKLIFVKSHWRGSPALGLKRSRYKLAA